MTKGEVRRSWWNGINANGTSGGLTKYIGSIRVYDSKGRIVIRPENIEDEILYVIGILKNSRRLMIFCTVNNLTR